MSWKIQAVIHETPFVQKKSWYQFGHLSEMENVFSITLKEIGFAGIYSASDNI